MDVEFYNEKNSNKYDMHPPKLDTFGGAYFWRFSDKEPRWFSGEVTNDFYGRKVSKHAHRTENLNEYTSSLLLLSILTLYSFGSIMILKEG